MTAAPENESGVQPDHAGATVSSDHQQRDSTCIYAFNGCETWGNGVWVVSREQAGTQRPVTWPELAAVVPTLRRRRRRRRRRRQRRRPWHYVHGIRRPGKGPNEPRLLGGGGGVLQKGPGGSTGRPSAWKGTGDALTRNKGARGASKRPRPISPPLGPPPMSPTEISEVFGGGSGGGAGPPVVVVTSPELQAAGLDFKPQAPACGRSGSPSSSVSAVTGAPSEAAVVAVRKRRCIVEHDAQIEAAEPEARDEWEEVLANNPGLTRPLGDVIEVTVLGPRGTIFLPGESGYGEFCQLIEAREETKEEGCGLLCSDAGGVVRPCVRPGMILHHVIDSRPGLLRVGPSGKLTATAQSGTTEVTFPRLHTDEYKCDERVAIICVPFLKALCKKFGTTKYDAKLVAAAGVWATSHVSGLEGGLERAVIDNTLEYFWLRTRLLIAGVYRHALSCGIMTSSPPLVVDRDIANILAPICTVDLGETDGEPLRVRGEELPPTPYTIRTDLRFTRCAGTIDDAERAAARERLTGAPVEVPLFSTEGIGKETSVLYYYLFAGEDNQFVWPSMSTSNLYGGLKRVLGERANERHLAAAHGRAYEALLVASPWAALSASEVGFLGCGTLYGHDGTEKCQCHSCTPCVRGGAEVCHCRECIGLMDGFRETVVETVVQFLDPLMSRSRLEQLSAGVGWMAHIGVGRLRVGIKKALLWGYRHTHRKYLQGEHLQYLRESAAEIEHIKRDLRRSYVEGVRIHDMEGLMVGVPKVAPKLEWAKPGKAQRLVVGYDAGCMYRNEIPEFVKKCLDGVHVIRCGGMTVSVYVVMKTDTKTLESAFRHADDVRTQEGEAVVVVHSDDMLLSFNWEGVAFTGNIDISSCDASNREYAFLLTHMMLRRFSAGAATGLIGQCQQGFRVVNPANPEETFVVTAPVFEGSGTVLTTILNTGASLTIAFGMLHAVQRIHPRRVYFLESDWSPVLQGAARATGYVVTIDLCQRDGDYVPELMTFLKHFWCKETQQVILCYGSMLRSLGTLRGSESHETFGLGPAWYANSTPAERAHRLCSGVVAGLVHEPPSVVMGALRARFNADGWVMADAAYHRQIVQDTEARTIDVSRAVRARYDLTSDEVIQLHDAVLQIRVGQTARLSAITKMMELDYGLPANC